jgi:hypothetical protein
MSANEWLDAIGTCLGGFGLAVLIFMAVWS